MISMVAVIRALRPGTEWSLNGDDIENVTWHTEGVEPITREEYEAALPQIEHDYEMAAVRAARHAAYAAPDGPDALFMQWQRGDATEQQWLDAVQAVKDAHPYPSAE
jgi:hypothetical protein